MGELGSFGDNRPIDIDKSFFIVALLFAFLAIKRHDVKKCLNKFLT